MARVRFGSTPVTSPDGAAGTAAQSPVSSPNDHWPAGVSRSRSLRVPPAAALPTAAAESFPGALPAVLPSQPCMQPLPSPAVHLCGTGAHACVLLPCTSYFGLGALLVDPHGPCCPCHLSAEGRPRQPLSKHSLLCLDTPALPGRDPGRHPLQVRSSRRAQGLVQPQPCASVKQGTEPAQKRAVMGGTFWKHLPEGTSEVPSMKAQLGFSCDARAGGWQGQSWVQGPPAPRREDPATLGPCMRLSCSVSTGRPHRQREPQLPELADHGAQPGLLR